MISKKFSLLCVLLLLLILSPSVTDCRGGRGGGGRSSSSSSSSRSSYSSASRSTSTSSTSSSPTTRSYTTVSVYSYYRPSYYYYSYYYGGVIYVGAYYGYTNGSTNLTAIIVPCAIIGTLFLLIVLCIIVGKCTNRDCLGACACMFCCQCSDDTKLIPPNE